MISNPNLIRLELKQVINAYAQLFFSYQTIISNVSIIHKYKESLDADRLIFGDKHNINANDHIDNTTDNQNYHCQETLFFYKGDIDSSYDEEFDIFENPTNPSCTNINNHISMDLQYGITNFINTQYISTIIDTIQAMASKTTNAQPNSILPSIFGTSISGKIKALDNWIIEPKKLNKICHQPQ
jgi:hypothetical protein